jgi:hypothetical protein
VREHGPLVVSGAGGVQDGFLPAKAACLRASQRRKLGEEKPRPSGIKFY